MFPHTDDINPVASTHVETIVLIERIRNAKDYVQIGIDAEDYYRIKEAKKIVEKGNC